MARRGHATALTDGQWLHLSSFLPPLGLGHPLRNGQVDHVAFPSHLFSLLDKDTSLQSTLTSLKGVVQALKASTRLRETCVWLHRHSAMVSLTPRTPT